MSDCTSPPSGVQFFSQSSFRQVSAKQDANTHAQSDPRHMLLRIALCLTSPRRLVFRINFTPPQRGVLLFGHPIIDMTRIYYGFSFPLKPYVD